MIGLPVLVAGRRFCCSKSLPLGGSNAPSYQVEHVRKDPLRVCVVSVVVVAFGVFAFGRQIDDGQSVWKNQKCPLL